MYTESQATIIEVGSDGSDVCTPGDPISDQRTSMQTFFIRPALRNLHPPPLGLDNPVAAVCKGRAAVMGLLSP